MDIKLTNHRLLLFLTSCLSLDVIAFALYLEHYHGLEPCPLCVLQRIAFFFTGALAFIASFSKNPTTWVFRALSFGALLSALAGLGVALRHVWLQSLPKDLVPACGPDLSYMLDTLSALSVLRNVLTGSGQCAEIDWTFLTLSMPQWSAITFFCLISLILLALIKNRRFVPVAQ